MGRLASILKIMPATVTVSGAGKSMARPVRWCCLETAVAVPEGASAPGGGRVLGYATFRRVGRESELLRVAVAPDRRDRGIGGRLIEAGLARLRDEGVATCFLEVRPTNAPALALYERLGFARISRRRRYFPDGSDALVLEVEIGGR
jgi:ribosomal-protein-alanine acetyltransferase